MLLATSIGDVGGYQYPRCWPPQPLCSREELMRVGGAYAVTFHHDRSSSQLADRMGSVLSLSIARFDFTVRYTGDVYVFAGVRQRSLLSVED